MHVYKGYKWKPSKGKIFGAADKVSLYYRLRYFHKYQGKRSCYGRRNSHEVLYPCETYMCMGVSCFTTVIRSTVVLLPESNISELFMQFKDQPNTR